MLATLSRWLAPRSPLAPVAPLRQQGYLDERSTHHVRGWMRDLNDETARLAFEVVLPQEGSDRILARGTANAFSATLVAVGVGDGTYAFDVRFDPPLLPADRDRVLVRPVGGTPLEHAPALVTTQPGIPLPRHVGYVDERSASHLAGWVWNEAEPGARIPFEVLDGGRVVHRGVADEWSGQLATIGIGDAAHAFRVLLPVPVEDRTALQVRVANTTTLLPLAPLLQERFEPISHVALDVVNNCNLRCPFCTYDYAGVRTTHFMDDATFQSALRLLPYVTEGNFWLSCLHEATIHPELLRFIDMVPAERRDRLMYTTNLAKRMPDAYFAQLGASGMHHLNISLESLVPATYERLRKGARLPIFLENWDKLLAACATGTAPPRLRYNMMAYRSNLAELPDLVALLMAEKRAWQVEIRYTYDAPHIPDAFRQAEYLRPDEWALLRARLAHHDPARVLLIAPPEEALAATAAPLSAHLPGPVAPPTRPAYPLGIRIEWDGTLLVYSEGRAADGAPTHTNHLTTNIRDVAEPRAMIADMLA